jgi:hypothetical protein
MDKKRTSKITIVVNMMENPYRQRHTHRTNEPELSRYHNFTGMVERSSFLTGIEHILRAG